VRGVLQSGKLFRHPPGVKEIDRDVPAARRGIGGPARQADDGPVALLEQPRDDVAPITPSAPTTTACLCSAMRYGLNSHPRCFIALPVRF